MPYLHRRIRLGIGYPHIEARILIEIAGSFLHANSQIKEQKSRLFSNIAAAMDGVSQEIIDRQLVHFSKADPEYAVGVKAELKVTK